MRNIICTSAICVSMAGVALAEVPLTKGCFVRNYSKAHLAKHPKQVVDWIRVKVFKDRYDQTIADIDVLFAHQGHARLSGYSGQIVSGMLHCWEYEGRIGCSLDCDGGSILIKKDDGDRLVFETDNVMIGETDSCGGAISLAEEFGKTTTYLVKRVDDAACEEN